jgi:RimJ/RimL family protein N-acetyltransferase
MTQPSFHSTTFTLSTGNFQGSYTVRPLTPEDFQQLKAVRLEALRNFGALFGPLEEDEAKFSDEEWREQCRDNEKGRCILGLFHGGKLIGIASIKPSEGDPSGQTALWCQAYIKPEYRGQKIFSYLRDERIAWTKAHSPYKQAVFFIHESNSNSRGAHAKSKPVHTGRGTMEWPGRPPAIWDFYRVDFDK